MPKKLMPRIITNEHKSVIEDAMFRKTAERLVLLCGVRADLSGYRCLTDAIILYGTEMCSGFGEIYDIVGQYREIQAKSVMRDICYAIRQSYDLRRKMCEMLGIDISDADIHNGLVIAYLSAIFRDPKNYDAIFRDRKDSADTSRDKKDNDQD